MAICVVGQHSNLNESILFWKLYDTLKQEVKVKKKKDKNAIMGKCVNIIKRTGKPCDKNGIVNSRGRAYCGKHDPTRKHTPEDTQSWCFSMLNILPSITKELRSALEANSVPESVIEIIIEQQSMDNKKILLQSHIIFGHFVSEWQNRVTVRFIPAYNKLLVYQGPEITCALKTPYARRKYFAKKHTEHFLEGKSFSTWLTYYQSCKGKQDDISDAFLQALYVLRKHTLPLKKVTNSIKKKRRKLRW